MQVSMDAPGYLGPMGLNSEEIAVYSQAHDSNFNRLKSCEPFKCCFQLFAIVYAETRSI